MMVGSHIVAKLFALVHNHVQLMHSYVLQSMLLILLEVLIGIVIFVIMNVYQIIYLVVVVFPIQVIIIVIRQYVYSCGNCTTIK